MKNQDLKEQLQKIKSELMMLYEISNAMRATLKLDEIFYIILTAVTAHAGLGFNRAMLFLINEEKNLLEGRMGIGPDTGEMANRIWSGIDASRTSLDDLISSYGKNFDAEHPSKLNQTVQNIKLPLKEESGFIALSCLDGMPLTISKDDLTTRPQDAAMGQLQLEEFCVVPLKAKDKVIGAIVVDNIFTKKPIDTDDIWILNLFANQAGLAIENARLYEKTLILARTDSLTGLWNHAQFQYLLDEELKRSNRYAKPLCLAIIDIDNFKPYNDYFGHQSGDEALKWIAKLLKETARTVDSVSRYGGEEFTIILPETQKGEAFKAIERLRIRVKEEFGKPPHQLQYNHQLLHNWCGGKLTISAGIASYPSDAKDKENLIHNADVALYEAKHSGKNKTVLFYRTDEHR